MVDISKPIINELKALKKEGFWVELERRLLTLDLGEDPTKIQSYIRGLLQIKADNKKKVDKELRYIFSEMDRLKSIERGV